MTRSLVRLQRESKTNRMNLGSDFQVCESTWFTLSSGAHSWTYWRRFSVSGAGHLCVIYSMWRTVFIYYLMSHSDVGVVRLQSVGWKILTWNSRKHQLANRGKCCFISLTGNRDYFGTASSTRASSESPEPQLELCCVAAVRLAHDWLIPQMNDWKTTFY